MSLDRFITVRVVHPIRRLLCTRGSQSIHPEHTLPVLMYHSICEDPEAGIPAYYRTCTTPGTFARHMALLEADGWRGITLSAGLDWLASRQQATHSTAPSGVPSSVSRPAPERKPVVITFDDGFRDFRTAAFPVLERHGFNATVFLATSFIGEESRQFKSRDCLTWNEVLELHRAGTEFGSHTVTHPHLAQIDWPEIEGELRESKLEIERRLHAPVRTFAYPYAFPQADRRFIERFGRLLNSVGYECCVTTRVGCVREDDDRLRWPRLPANSADDNLLLRAKIEGAYNWVAVPQACSKNLAHWLRLLGRTRSASKRSRASIELRS